MLSLIRKIGKLPVRTPLLSGYSPLYSGISTCRRLTTPSEKRQTAVSSVCKHTSLFIGINVVSGLLFGSYIPVEASKIASYVALGSMLGINYLDTIWNPKYISKESLQKVCLGSLVVANSVYIPHQLFHSLPQVVVPTLAVSSAIFAASAFYGYIKPLNSLSHFSKYTNYMMIPLTGLYVYSLFNPVYWQLHGIGSVGLLAFLSANIAKETNNIHTKKYSDLCNVYFFAGFVLIVSKTLVLSLCLL